MDEQYELEVILHEMEVLGTNLSDMEKMVKNYTKERLKALKDRSQAVCSPHKGPSKRLKRGKGRKTPEGGSN